MKIYGFSLETRALIDILDLFLESNSGDLNLLQKKIDSCPYEVFLIGGQLKFYDQFNLSGQRSRIISQLHQLWCRYWNHNQKSPKLLNEGLKRVNMFSRGVNNIENLKNSLIFQMKDDPKRLSFFIMLRKDARLILPISEITYMVNYWKFEQGYLPLHSSGVIHQGGLYLFIGPSGAGKSTISKISEKVGDDVLDEDQVLIYHTFDDNYFADAWGYSLKKGKVPIRAIFQLIKDQSDLLIPLAKNKAAKLLSDQSLVIFGDQISDISLKNIFQKCAQIARSIPCFELHFTKSPVFWKLIDEERLITLTKH